MPGGRVGGGGSASGGGGGRIGGGGGFGGGRVGGGSWGGSSRPSYGRPSSGRPSSSRPSSGYRPTHYPVYVRPVYYNGGGGGGNHNSSSNGGSSSSGCLTLLVIFLVIFFLMILFSSLDSGGDVTASTVQREPLSAGSVNLTGYYEDSTGLIRRSSVLQSGMKHFYDKTGVQPFLYVTQTINGDPDPDDATMEAYAQQLYSELFTDSGHFLLVVYDPGNDGFLYYYIPGNASKTVLDGEALEIFEGYLFQESDEYLSGSAESYFSDVFALTADRIMSVTVNPMVYVAGIAVVLAILWLLYRWWRKAKEQKNKENEHMQHVLETDIEDLVSDPELKDLEEKYGSDTAEKPKPKPKPQTQPKPDDGFTDMDLKDPALADLEEKYKD